jgi:chromosome segregation ATPase
MLQLISGGVMPVITVWEDYWKIMEDTKMERLEIKMNELDKSVSVYQVILERFNTTSDKLACSIDNLNDVVIKMQAEISNNSRELVELKTKIDLQEKSANVNWMDLVKQNIIPIVMFLYIVIEHVYGIKP